MKRFNEVISESSGSTYKKAIQDIRQAAKGSHLKSTDKHALEQIAGDLESGNVETAAKIAARMDTFLRDIVFDAVWDNTSKSVGQQFYRAGGMRRLRESRGGMSAAVKRAEKSRQAALKKARAARKRGMSDKEIKAKFDLQDWELKKLDEGRLVEALSASDPIETWIKDFVHSDNPKFEGKTKAERIDMAKGAYYAAQKDKKEELVTEGIVGQKIGRPMVARSQPKPGNAAVSSDGKPIHDSVVLDDGLIAIGNRGPSEIWLVNVASTEVIAKLNNNSLKLLRKL